MRNVRIIVGILLLISVFVSIDLGLNYLYNLVPENHDGYSVNSILHSIFNIFGDSNWTLDGFFNAFKTSVWVSFGLLTFNIILSIKTTSKKRSIFML